MASGGRTRDRRLEGWGGIGKSRPAYVGGTTMPKFPSNQLRAVKIRRDGPVTGHGRIGRDGIITFSRGVAIFHTVPGALKRMRDLHRRASGSKQAVTLRSVRRLEPWQARILYERAVPCALAT